MKSLPPIEKNNYINGMKKSLIVISPNIDFEIGPFKFSITTCNVNKKLENKLRVFDKKLLRISE